MSLLSAKSRIAPKKATILRLELMGASIAVRLASAVVESLTRKVERITYWTDSMTVLAWLRRDMQWSTFVWNRVNEIRSMSDIGDWRYVPTQLNPADLPSRGCNSSQLKETEWWLGPHWLRESESNWPSTAVAFNEEEVRNEIKKGATVHMISLNKKSFKVSDYFSSYVKLIRFLARMHRFTDNCKSAVRKRKLGVKDSNPARIRSQNTSLTYKEMQSAENKLLKYLQEQMLKDKLKEKLNSFK